MMNDLNNILVDSLWRIYNTCKPIKLTKDDVKARVASGKITKETYEYITGEKYEEQKIWCCNGIIKE